MLFWKAVLTPNPRCPLPLPGSFVASREASHLCPRVAKGLSYGQLHTGSESPARYAKTRNPYLFKPVFVGLEFWYLSLKIFCINRVTLLEEFSPFFLNKKNPLSTLWLPGLGEKPQNGSVSLWLRMTIRWILDLAPWICWSLVDLPSVKVLVIFSWQVLFGSTLVNRGKLAPTNVGRGSSARELCLLELLSLSNVYFK